MEVMKEITTNKAKLVFRSDGRVEKRFFDYDRAIKEKESIDSLNRTFPGENLNAWSYKTVRLLEFDLDTTSIHMEIAEGSTMGSTMVESPKLVCHMGTWLGLYHNHARSKEDKDKVSLFGDYSRNNFIIDIPSKLATAIDPGYHFGEVDYPEYDLMVGVYSLVLGALKAKKSAYKIVDDFTRAYNQATDKPIDYRHLLDSWSRVREKFAGKYKNKSILVRPLAYIAMHGLNAYISLIIRRLKRNLNTTK